jgi:dolichol-phosphate mannosyltransferase
MKNISIVIPVYNEEKNIKILIKEIMNIQSISYINEIIIIDDHSTDNSKAEIIKLAKLFNIIKFFSHSKNLGQSKSLLTGIQIASSESILTMDADLQNNPQDIEKLIKLYYSDENIKLVGGIRLNRKDSLKKIISSKIANSLRILILKDECKDTGCSLKIFDRELFLNLPFFDGIHRFLPALFKYSKSVNKFVNVDHRVRRYGISKYGTVGRAFKGLLDVIKVKKIIKGLVND